MEYDLDKAIRKVPDFPKPGILFYDITSILIETEAFRFCVDRMLELFKGRDIQGIAAVESRGFIFASPLALAMDLPLILMRKKGKLPGETLQISFSLEYGEDVLEMHRDDISAGQKILLVDDLIATGGTLKAACSLLEMRGAEVAGILAVVGLPFLNYQEILSGYSITTLINYRNE